MRRRRGSLAALPRNIDRIFDPAMRGIPLGQPKGMKKGGSLAVPPFPIIDALFCCQQPFAARYTVRSSIRSTVTAQPSPRSAEPPASTCWRPAPTT